MKQINTKTYLTTLIATCTIFLFAFAGSNYLTNKKTEQLKADEAKISINIISLETEYDLLKESSCDTFTTSGLRAELDSLALKLNYMEGQLGEDNSEVFRLKRYYSLLEIKDYLLSKKMSEQCKTGTIFVLYFYANKDCPDCQNQQYYLKAISDEFPKVEIYSFDYNLDLNAVQTLISLHNIPPKPPVIDINGTAYASFDSLQSLRDVLARYTK